LAFTRLTHPSAMKFGFPSTVAPSRVTGMGNGNAFFPTLIFPFWSISLIALSLQKGTINGSDYS
jgi:hypothetical protein